jgi:hypothetical protein
MIHLTFFLLNLDEFDNCHLGVISLPSDSSQNTSVSSVALAITIGGGFEQRVNKLLVVDPSKGLTTCVQVSSLSQFDHMIHVLSDRLGTNQGSLDASMPDGFGGQGTEEGLSLIRRKAQFLESLAVANHAELRASGDGSTQGDGPSQKGASAGDYKQFVRVGRQRR